MTSTQGRIEFLDGLRGLAILLVVIWHCYGPTYAEHLPFRDQFAIFPIRDLWVGVELFFLISGFVIAMTLEKCETLIEFGVRRWLRLFPAMLIASVLILAYDMTIGIGPHAHRTFINLLPGLLFINPAIIHTLTGLSAESMDGTFWSLYVEVSFYFLFGIFYYRSGLLTAIVLIFALSVLACTMGYIANAGLGGSLFGRFAAALDWLGFVHFGWFASGALFYEYFRTRRASLFFAAVLSGVVAALDWKPNYFSFENRIVLLGVVFVFALVVWSRTAQRFFSTRSLLLMGSISYPLYLIHANIAVGLTEMGHGALPIPSWLFPVGPIVLVAAIAFFIAHYFEPVLRRTFSFGLEMLVATVLPAGAPFRITGVERERVN